MPNFTRNTVSDTDLEQLLGLESSKIGFYSEVKQKIRELESTAVDLRSKRNELQAIFDAIQDGLAIYGADGRIQQRNHVCPALLPNATLPGRYCGDLFHPDTDTEPTTCPVEGALHGETRELTFTRLREGQPRHFEATAAPILGSYGRPARALVFLRDVTDRRMEELQLHQAEKMSSLGVLSAGVAHEINNPLNSIGLYAESLQRRLVHEDGCATLPQLEGFPEYLQVIVREAQRCKGIIDTLLTFSRKSEGGREPVDLGNLIGEVLDLAGCRSEYEQVKLETSLASNLPSVLGDPSELRQVVLNLTLNALQAVAEDGAVEIATRPLDGWVALRISDDGCGIPPTALERIWDPFYTTKPVGKGLGLGLPVVYNIVRKHGGEVRIESEEGRGSIFTVMLPAEETAACLPR